MKKSFKIKVLIALMLILTISLISTNSNASMLNMGSLNFTELTTKLTEGVAQTISKAREAFQKIVEGFDIGVEKTENGLKMNLNFDYAGQFITVESENDGVVQFDISSMSLTAAGLGDTVIHLKIGEKDIPIKVSVSEGGIQLMPQGTGVTVNGVLKAKFDISENEMSNIDAAVQGEAGLINGGLGGTLTSTQNLTLFQKLKMNFAEQAKGEVNMSGATGQVAGEVGIADSLTASGAAGGQLNMSGIYGEAGGAVGVGGNEMASGTAGVGYQFGAQDPVANVSGSVLGNKLLNLQNITIPVSKVITALKLMITKIPLPF